MRNLKAFLANLSSHPGVYQMLGDKGEILYVGKAKNLKKRVSSYFNNRVLDAKTVSLVKQIKDITITVTNSENEAVLLECNLIKHHRPHYNVLLRDDKSFPYIYISKHAYPRIDIYRGKRRKTGQYFGPFPNSTAVRETINLLQKTFKIRTCTDSYYSARERPCLLYQIDRCTAPCVNLISKQDYSDSIRLATLFLQGKSDEVIDDLQGKMQSASDKKAYEQAAAFRDQISRLRKIQEKQYVSVAGGDADVIGLAIQAGVVCLQLLEVRNGQIMSSKTYFPKAPANSVPEEILSAFITQHYFAELTHGSGIPKQILIAHLLADHDFLVTALTEQAAHKVEIATPSRGDKKKWLAMAQHSANESLAAHILNKTNMRERIAKLKEALHLAKTPKRFECFDISHSMGEATVASCVVFNQEGPLKSDYRRFNISDITPGDDVAAMRQAVGRRFKRIKKGEALVPDVVFIDGGKTQLTAAKEALDDVGLEDVLLVGVSKGPDRKPGFETLHFTNKKTLHLSVSSVALHFIQQIRDEAHRFAITGHRMKRGKARTKSVLESIPGVGAKKRRALLRYFGGIQGISCASLDELMKVQGINRSLAERIFATLHDSNI